MALGTMETRDEVPGAGGWGHGAQGWIRCVSGSICAVGGWSRVHGAEGEWVSNRLLWLYNGGLLIALCTS